MKKQLEDLSTMKQRQTNRITTFISNTNFMGKMRLTTKSIFINAILVLGLAFFSLPQVGKAQCPTVDPTCVAGGGSSPNVVLKKPKVSLILNSLV